MTKGNDKKRIAGYYANFLAQCKRRGVSHDTTYWNRRLEQLGLSKDKEREDSNEQKSK